MKYKKPSLRISIILTYSLFLFISSVIQFNPGLQIARNFTSFSLQMIKVLPCAFILIGLFETWVHKEHVEKFMGEKSGSMGYALSIVLAGTTVGGLYVAFPVAYSLFRKGARLSYIFTYVGAAAICRIPMTIFEATFLGIKFSIIRLLVSVPLVILSAIWLEFYLKSENYVINNPH